MASARGRFGESRGNGLTGQSKGGKMSASKLAGRQGRREGTAKQLSSSNSLVRETQPLLERMEKITG
jgi:hypothetical protein